MKLYKVEKDLIGYTIIEKSFKHPEKGFLKALAKELNDGWRMFRQLAEKQKEELIAQKLEDKQC